MSYLLTLIANPPQKEYYNDTTNKILIKDIFSYNYVLKYY